MEPTITPWDEFKSFSKIPRLNRECVISEKIDGTNASVSINPEGTEINAASRTRWISVGSDNFGFAKWVEDNRVELLRLGPGRHFGEWWGVGIQRGYGLSERRFSLFHPKWQDEATRPACCKAVPILYHGPFNTTAVQAAVGRLEIMGSRAVPGFMKPEGVVVYHMAAGQYFKVTVENDAQHKSQV